MKLTINILLINLMVLVSCTGTAQKQTFDVISFSAPAGWQQQQTNGALQLTATDKKTGAYVLAIITKAKPSAATANENFTSQWEAAIKGQMELDGEPVMQPATQGNGWNIVTGGAGYTDNGSKGNVALLSATGNGQTVSVILITNTKQYEKELSAFLNSLELSKAAASPEANNKETANEKNNPASLVGLWVDYQLETSGYSNGMPMYSAGYFRKEYQLNADGSYVYRLKNWSTTIKEILFVYETGSWKVNGNQLTITPKKGKGGWWNKAASGKTSEWGSLKKAADIKQETVSYTFELHYYEGVKETHLLLQNNNPTERDGRSNNGNQNNQWSYRPRKQGTSIIDNPPGFNTGIDNKTSVISTTPNLNGTIANSSPQSPLAGKIWEGSSSEKFSSTGSTNAYQTGGFSTSQYKFNADGTYRFVNVVASHYTNTKSFCFETGTWLQNGNQLTITPAKGQNEEWTKSGKTSNGNSDVTNRTINQSWGKKLKTTSRKLEKYTYGFSIGKNGDQTALILERNSRTEREGEGNIACYNETSVAKSVKLPVGVK